MISRNRVVRRSVTSTALQWKPDAQTGMPMTADLNVGGDLHLYNTGFRASSLTVLVAGRRWRAAGTYTREEIALGAVAAAALARQSA